MPHNWRFLLNCFHFYIYIYRAWFLVRSWYTLVASGQVLVHWTGTLELYTIMASGWYIGVLYQSCTL